MTDVSCGEGGRARFARRAFLGSILIIVMGLAGSGAGEEPPGSRDVGLSSLRAEEVVFFFAQHLFDEGDYARAITEYKRFCFLQPAHSLVPLARVKIGMAQCRLGQWEEAYAVFRDIYRRHPQNDVAPKALYLMGEARFAQGDFSGAIANLRRVEAEYPSSAASEQACLLIGWSYARLGRWAQAAQAFSTVRDGSPYAVVARSLEAGVKAGEALPRRKPALAGLMSAVMPGMGQVYAHRYRDALAAFLVNTGFIVAIVLACRARNWALAAILIVVEAGWYVGTIYGAVSAIEKQNLQVREAFVEQLMAAHQFHLLSTTGA